MSARWATALRALLLCAAGCEARPELGGGSGTVVYGSPRDVPILPPDPCNGLDDNGNGVVDEGWKPCPRRYDCADPANCGCARSHRRCGDACVNADSPVADCDGACRDLASDPDHCGACGHACRAGDACIYGVCRCGESSSARCGDECVEFFQNPLHCGACGRRCGEGFVCDLSCQCPYPFIVLGNRCVPRGTGGTCGGSAVRCPLGTVCINGGCGCRAMCQSVCIDTATDPRHCGACERACARGEVCVSSRCDCPAPRTSCDAGCVDLLTDRANCGACGNACAASASCFEGVCRQRLGAPAAGERVGSRRPTLRWPGMAGAAEVCADRACARVLRSVAAPPAGVVVVAEPLTPGWYFWRIRGVGASLEDSSVASFRVDRRDAARTGLLPPAPDLDGDGRGDVVVAAGPVVAVYFGASPALPAEPGFRAALGALGSATALRVVGDANGDGFGDVFVDTTDVTYANATLLGGPSAASLSLPWRYSLAREPVPALDVNGDGVGDELVDLTEGARVVYGDPLGAEASPVSLDGAAHLRAAAPAGDVDGDGYRDVVVATSAATGTPRVRAFLGSATGLDRSFEAPAPPAGTSFRGAVASAGDVNGDGFADVLVELAPAGAALYLGGADALTLHRALAPPAGGALRVSAAGDVDGDGFDDLVSFGGGDALGWIRGGAAGLAEAPVTLRDPRWAGVTAVGAPRDVDGDGFDDLVLAAPGSGAVYVLHGAATRALARVEALAVAAAPAPTLLVL